MTVVWTFTNELRAAAGTERYGKHLSEEQLGWFADCGYEASFHVTRLRQALAHRGDGGTVDAVVRNRRFVKAIQLQQAGDFFSSDSIKERAPALHEQMVGRFSTPSAAPVSVRLLVPAPRNYCASLTTVPAFRVPSSRQC